MGGKNSGSQIHYPDLSNYVWDGSEEPVLPPTLIMADALEVTQKSIERCLELAVGTDYLSQTERSLFAGFFHLVTSVLKSVMKVHRAQWKRDYANSQRLVPRNKPQSSLLQNDDTSTPVPGWKGALAVRTPDVMFESSRIA